MASWVGETAPDLRRRAAVVRMDSGDLSGGLLWAGFTPRELAAYKGDALGPEGLLLANSVANGKDPKAYEFRRKPNESLNDWLDRLKAHALTRIPGLQPFEPAVQYLIGTYGDWRSVTDAGGKILLHGTSLTKVLLGNSFKQGWGRAWKNRAARGLQRIPEVRIARWGQRMEAWNPKLRSARPEHRRPDLGAPCAGWASRAVWPPRPSAPRTSSRRATRSTPSSATGPATSRTSPKWASTPR